MIAGQWMLAARGVSVDKNNGGITLFCVVEGIVVASYPAFSPLAIAAALTRQAGDPERIDAQLSVEQHGHAAGPFPVVADFQGALKTCMVIELQGFMVAGPGDVTFTLQYEGRTIGQFVFTVQGPAAQLA